MNIGHLVRFLFLDHTYRKYKRSKVHLILPSSSSPPLNSQNDTQVGNNYNSLLFLYVYNRKSLDEERQKQTDRERERGRERGKGENMAHVATILHYPLLIDWQ
jgi:hypothetical protein